MMSFGTCEWLLTLRNSEKRLEDFAKHLQAGPDGLDESRRTLNAIEKLGASVAKQLRVRSSGHQVRGRIKSLAATSARRLQWLALWIHGQSHRRQRGRIQS